ncbi:hypothetical protein RHGRI_005953 [Rhododendron griersonianum]|nr:hypothetical protein RHGRI_005953 [Rhododendron griersonianum]
MPMDPSSVYGQATLQSKSGLGSAEFGCEVGSGGKLSLFTDLLGDPICRVRHSPAYLMLVAEALKVGEGGGDKEESEIVGMIRGCIKSVTCGKKFSRSSSGKNCPTPIYTKLAYILGLRVSPSHRYLSLSITHIRTYSHIKHSNHYDFANINAIGTNGFSTDGCSSQCLTN